MCRLCARAAGDCCALCTAIHFDAFRAYARTHPSPQLREGTRRRGRHFSPLLSSLTVGRFMLLSRTSALAESAATVAHFMAPAVLSSRTHAHTHILVLLSPHTTFGDKVD